MIFEYFRATRAYEAVQGLPDLFKKRFQNDDVQDYDVKWDQALLSTIAVLAMYDQEIVRNNGETSYSRLKTSAK